MKKKNGDIFWMSFSDLMISLFFVVLVLYVLTYVMLKQKENELQYSVKDLKNKENELQYLVKDLKNKLRIYDLVEQSLKPLKNNSKLFRYEKQHKRFTLAFDVNFELSQFEIKEGKLSKYDETSQKIEDVGKELQHTINILAKKKVENIEMKNVSYLVIISGYASHLLRGKEVNDYELSYKRAYNLWSYWKKKGIDFELKKYKGLIDLQISGNGWGGVGRFETETKNQRFIIQIVPKIENTK